MFSFVKQMAAPHSEVMMKLLVAVRFAAETKSAVGHFHYALKTTIKNVSLKP